MKRLNELTSLFFSRFVDQGLRQVEALEVTKVSQKAERPHVNFQTHFWSEKEGKILIKLFLKMPDH